jgi:hypothetical protein
MKKLITVIVFSISIMQATAQNDEFKQFYLGLGTGLNSVGLIGLNAEYIFNNRIGIVGSAGLGTWGTKSSIGARFYFKNPTSGALHVSFARASGVNGVVTQLDTVDNAGTAYPSQITFNAKPVSLFNIAYQKFWRLGNSARFHIEAGYSIPLNGKSPNNYQITAPQNIELSETSQSVMRILQPGGLMIGIGFTFGIF